MYKSKKAMTPVISLMLILLITVISAVSLYGWFEGFSPGFADEYRTVDPGEIQLKYLVSEDLGVISYAPIDVDFESIKLNSIECEKNGTIKSREFNTFNLEECDFPTNTCSVEVSLVTDRGFFSENLFTQECRMQSQ